MLDRDNSVKKFIFNYLDNKITQIYNINNKEIQICTEDGLILGHFDLIDYDEEETGRLIVCSTFLSIEMLKANQLTMWKDAQAQKLKLKDPYYVLGDKV